MGKQYLIQQKQGQTKPGLEHQHQGTRTVITGRGEEGRGRNWYNVKRYVRYAQNLERRRFEGEADELSEQETFLLPLFSLQTEQHVHLQHQDLKLT